MTTWSSTDLSYITLSGGDLTATTQGISGAVRGTDSHDAGKWYFEVTYDANPGYGSIYLGLANASAALNNYYNDPDRWTYIPGGFTCGDGVDGPSTTSWAIGDVVGVAVDLGAGKVWFAVNNAWVESGDPSTGVNPTLTFSGETMLPIFGGISDEGDATITAAFEAAGQAYAAPSGFTAWGDAPVDINYATAQIGVSIITRTGSAAAPMEVSITGNGAASAPIDIGIVDSLETARWSARVVLGGVDVSARLVGSLSVDAEEGAARVAQFSMSPAAGVVNPTAWVGVTVTIDLLRVIGTASVPSRLFTGRVDVPSFDPMSGLVRMACTDDLQNRVAALTKAEIDAIVGGRYHVGAQGEIDEHWAYAQARMESVAGSLDAGAQGGIRVTAWDGLATWATYTEADILDGSLSIQLPRRTDLVNRVDVTYQYRYHRCRERRINLSWSKSVIGSQGPASGYQYPTQDMIESALDGLGWHRLSTAYARAPLLVVMPDPFAGFYVECAGISNMVAWLGQRHAQAVTEEYTLTVTAPQSITASGELAVPLRGAYETTWTPDEWESDWTVSTPDASAADVDYAGDQTRAESDSCIRTLLDMAKARILGAHRTARVGFAIPCLPELDLVHAVAVDTASLDATGKVARLQHELDIDAGTATTRVTLALSGIASTGLATPTDLDPPEAPDVDEATGDDEWEVSIPHLGVYVGAATISTGYLDTMMGYIVNAPETYTITDGTDVQSVINNYYDAAEEYPTAGFRIACPGVADTHRNPITMASAADYAVEIPIDPVTLTVS